MSVIDWARRCAIRCGKELRGGRQHNSVGTTDCSRVWKPNTGKQKIVYWETQYTKKDGGRDENHT